VLARDSILATSAEDEPLVRVNEQSAVTPPRERIRWDGNAVAYHNITTYRRDQVAQDGSAPARFDRNDWELAVGDREVSPSHLDVHFLKEWDASRPLWTFAPDDARLAPDSPVVLSGPDLKAIPSPPARP
jgi:hypothetical protein